MTRQEKFDTSALVVILITALFMVGFIVGKNTTPAEAAPSPTVTVTATPKPTPVNPFFHQIQAENPGKVCIPAPYKIVCGN